jgi:hypothetical protein
VGAIGEKDKSKGKLKLSCNEVMSKENLTILLIIYV